MKKTLFAILLGMSFNVIATPSSNELVVLNQAPAVDEDPGDKSKVFVYVVKFYDIPAHKSDKHYLGEFSLITYGSQTNYYELGKDLALPDLEGFDKNPLSGTKIALTATSDKDKTVDTYLEYAFASETDAQSWLGHTTGVAAVQQVSGSTEEFVDEEDVDHGKFIISVTSTLVTESFTAKAESN